MQLLSRQREGTLVKLNHCHTAVHDDVRVTDDELYITETNGIRDDNTVRRLEPELYVITGILHRVATL